MNTMKKKILIPLLAVGMVVLLAVGVFGGYAAGFAKGQTKTADADLLLYVEEPRTYEGDYYAFPNRYPIGQTGWFEDCQIPTEVLKQLTTRQLFESCLRCPLHEEQWLSNDLLSTGYWMENLDDHFNGMRELRQREDLSVMLVDYFRDLAADRDAFEEEYAGRAAEITAYLVDRNYVEKDACFALREVLETSAAAGKPLRRADVLYATLNGCISGAECNPVLWGTDNAANSFYGSY